jgi:O-acetylserine/cysteine efflux transporter
MKIALEELPPLLFVGLRFAILIPLIAFFPRPAGWLPILAIGTFINSGQFAFLFSAMEADVTAGLASLILQSQAPITIILAAVFFGERVRLMQGLGIALACTGLALFGVAGGGNVTPIGLTLVLIGALSWSCGNLVLRRQTGVNMTALFIWASLVPPLPMLGLSMAGRGSCPLRHHRGDVAAGLARGGLRGLHLHRAGLLDLGRAPVAAPGRGDHALRAPDPGRGPQRTAALVLGETVTRGEAIAALVVLAGLALSVLGGKRRAG